MTKFSPRTEANLVKTSHATTFGQEKAQTSPLEEVWGRLAPWGGRPASPWAPLPYSFDVASPLWSQTSVLGGMAAEAPWLPPINTREGVENGTHTQTHHTSPHLPQGILVQSIGFGEFRRSLGVIDSPELLGSSGMGSSLVLSCNIRSFVIELDYGYRYLLEVCSELLNLCFVIWLSYHSMLALHDCPMLATVNILALEIN